MKKGPLIFLGILVITLFFILGIQFGKRVKTADEALQLLLTIAPSPSSTPPVSSISTPVRQLTSSTCGFSFLYPVGLEPKVVSSNSGALINAQQDTIISFRCDDGSRIIKEATTSVTFSGANGIEYTKNDTVTIEVNHPAQNLALELKFPVDYRTLIERTFEFIE